jgi:hypothetical protein
MAVDLRMSSIPAISSTINRAPAAGSTQGYPACISQRGATKIADTDQGETVSRHTIKANRTCYGARGWRVAQLRVDAQPWLSGALYISKL